MYNRASVIRRAIDGVLAQSMDDVELLVVDDMSTDGTVEIVESYLSDPRVRLTVNTRNLGPAGARNRGVGMTTGRYIAFQDSDDRWFPEKLALQIEALESNPGRRACYCGAVYFSPDQCYYIPRSGMLDDASRESGDITVPLLRSNLVTPQALLVERELFDELRGFNAEMRISEDWDLAIRMAQKTRFAFCAEPLVLIYRTAGSVSSSLAADTAARQKMMTDFAGLFADNPAARAAQNYIIGCQCLRIKSYADAADHFRRSFRDAPSLRCFAQIQRANLLRLTG